jgi:transposase
MMKRYKTGELREQIRISTLEDRVGNNSIVRFIDKFVEILDLKEMGFEYSETKDTGSKPYSPWDMLKLYLYGYFFGIRSSRKLETETKRNIELMWLICELSPDHKTIANFRKNNVDSIKKVFMKFITICREQGLIDCKVLGLDGTKVKAVNSRDKVHTKETIEKKEKYINEKINSYIQELDEADLKEENEESPSKERIEKALEILNKRKEKLQEIEQMVKTTGEQVAETDKESRLMKTRNGFDASYNVQAVVDGKNKLIIDYNVVNETSDINQLEPVIKAVKNEFELENFEVVADTGYRNSEQIENIQGIGATVYIPPKNTRPGEIEFKYNAENNTYTCTEGKTLVYSYNFLNKGKSTNVYHCKDCKDCPSRDKCTKSKNGRSIKILANQDVLDDMDIRVKVAPEKMRLRSQICEHPFGIMKQEMGFRTFLMRGLKKVNAEAGLTMLVFNMKRVINILKSMKTSKVYGYIGG